MSKPTMGPRELQLRAMREERARRAEAAQQALSDSKRARKAKPTPEELRAAAARTADRMMEKPVKGLTKKGAAKKKARKK